MCLSSTPGCLVNKQTLFSHACLQLTKTQTTITKQKQILNTQNITVCCGSKIVGLRYPLDTPKGQQKGFVTVYLKLIGTDQ